MSRIGRPVGLLLCLTLAVQIGGCTVLVPQAMSPGTVAPREFPGTVLLVLRDSSRVELYSARIEGDTIRGERKDTGPASVATAEVARWEARRFSRARTFAAAAMTTLVVAVIWLIVHEDPIEVINYSEI